MTWRFQFRKYRLPFRGAVNTAHGPWREREGVIVRLEDEAGRVGFGEAAPIPWFGTETVDEVVEACGRIGEWGEAVRFAEVRGRLGCLRNAIQAARGTVAEKSDGGAGAEGKEKADVERRVKDNAPYLAVAALLPAGRAVFGAIAPKAEAGFRVFKWKVGVGDMNDELALLDDLCAALPEGAKLRLDANGAWDRRRAEKWLERSAERPVEFVEQPIAADARGAVDLLRGLAEDFPTRIALDESVVTDGDVAHWIDVGWRGVFVVKPGLFGDVTGVMEQLEKAKADVVFSSALETAAGARAALRVAFAWTGERRALGFGVWPLFADGRFDGPAAAPFLRCEDVERIDEEAVWNALG